MKNLSLLVWLTQLGLSVAVMPALAILLAVWLKAKFSLGAWILWVGAGLGIYWAVMGLVSSLRTMERLSRKKKKDLPPSFNDHM